MCGGMSRRVPLNLVVIGRHIAFGEELVYRGVGHRVEITAYDQGYFLQVNAESSLLFDQSCLHHLQGFQQQLSLEQLDIAVGRIPMYMGVDHQQRQLQPPALMHTHIA